MIVALSNGNKLGLGIVALIIIAFALVSSFVAPRRNPDFPGRRGRGMFIFATVILVVAMLAAVVVFGEEDEGEQEHGGEARVAEIRAR